MKQYNKKWKDLSFDEKVKIIDKRNLYEGSDYKQLGEFHKFELRKRRDKRMAVATLLEMRGWIDVYDSLTILGMEDTRKNHLRISFLAKKHKLRKYLLGKINYFKKDEVINLSQILSECG
tara:strand:+ start:268 stop:627 length:360 start_codon:yes stop_codon:yes gene_type:complete